MDPIETINFKKIALAMMIEAQGRIMKSLYDSKFLFINSGISYVLLQTLKLEMILQLVSLEEEKIIKLSELDAILMRQDPPFGPDYIYNTYILEMASRELSVFNNQEA